MIFSLFQINKSFFHTRAWCAKWLAAGSRCKGLRWRLYQWLVFGKGLGRFSIASNFLP